MPTAREQCMKIAMGLLLGASVVILTGCEEAPNQTQPTDKPMSRTVAGTADANAGSEQVSHRVKAAIEHIHRLYNQRKFDALFALATQRMQKRIAKSQFLDVIKRVHSTLGTVRSFEVIKQKRAARGRALVLKVEYASGTGTERWVLQFTDQGVRWAAFLYNAPSLMGRR